MYKKESPLYYIWQTMKQRCNNPNATAYKSYGAKGIKICEGWNDFWNFVEDMGERPLGMTLDRIDNNKGYSKENCRWATRKEQALNRATNKYITYNNITLTIKEWGDKLGINESTFYYRVKNKMPIDMIMSHNMHTGNNQFKKQF